MSTTILSLSIPGRLAINLFPKALRLLLLLTVALVGFATSAQPAPAFLTNGLVAHYPFNGNVLDESGNGHHGVLHGNAYVTNDIIGGCVDFPGHLAHHVDFGGWFNFQEFSVGMWIFPRENSGYTSPIDNVRQQINSPQPRNWGLSTNPEDESHYDFNGAVVSLSRNRWTYLSFTASEGVWRVFTNGVQAAEVLGFSIDYLYPPRLWMGAWALNFSGDPRYWNGKIGATRMYERALSAPEIQSLYDYESLGNSGNPRVATATAQVVNGFVVGATVTDGGSGYTNAPVVSITGGNGAGATATATVINGVVTSVTIVNPGSGYTSTPTITIAPPPFPPRRALATATAVNGFVVSATVTDGGFGYTEPPAVRITGGGGTGATATATVANGVVTGIVVTNPGTGYTGTPTVAIASPPFTPELQVAVSRVNVALKVVLGRKYLLESSKDLQTWTAVGAPFVAESEEITQEFIVEEAGRFFRISQVP